MRYFGSNNVEGVLGGGSNELGGGGWRWVEVDGGGWRWAHGLKIPVYVYVCKM